MKSKTKWLTFWAVLWFSFLFFLLYLASISSAGEYSEFQKAKLIDCQSIQADQKFLKSPNWSHRSICFWHVKVGDKNLIMWQEVGTGKFGFVEE